jgi:ADP-ribose pyrophosphatase
MGAIAWSLGRRIKKRRVMKSMADSVIRLKRQLRYQGTILKIYEDTVLANGHEAHWDFIHHDGAAAVLPVTDDGKILMVRQYRNALDRETLEIPAGKLDAADEPKIQCAYRELEEETGYRTEHMEYLMSVNTTVAFCDEAIDIFVARDLIPSHQHLDEDEVIDVEAWELKDLLELIYSGKMTDAKTVAAITAYAVKFGGGK